MIFTIANILTICRIFMAPMFLVMMLTNTTWGIITGYFVFAIAALTDWFDGYLARKYGEETEQGEFLDPLADKVLTTTAFIVFLVGRFNANVDDTCNRCSRFWYDGAAQYCY